MLTKIKALFLITRPHNVIIALLSVFLAAIITGTLEPLQRLLLAASAVGLVAAGGNALNDYYDLDIDRLNKPNRPLPSNKLTPKSVFIYSIILYFIALICAFLLDFYSIIIVLSVIILLWFYNAKWKRLALIGNITVSFVASLSFILAGISVYRPLASIIPALLSFGFHLGRELIKDVEDIEGDKIAGKSHTLPIIWGTKKTLRLSAFIYIGVIILTLLPYIMQQLNILPLSFGKYGIWYLISVLLGVDIFLLYTIKKLLTSKNPNLSFISATLKADMLLGLLAIYLGRF